MVEIVCTHIRTLVLQRAEYTTHETIDGLIYDAITTDAVLLFLAMIVFLYSRRRGGCCPFVHTFGDGELVMFLKSTCQRTVHSLTEHWPSETGR